MNIRPFTAKHKTIGLVLGGGGARGLSHIGVLKALAEHHITPTHISGTSMGAIIAVLYASGYSIDHMIHTAKHLGWKQILPDWWDFWQQRKKGLLSMKYLHHVLHDLDYQTIESLPIPTRISTTSITTGRNILHHEGNIVELVSASAAIPGLFSPITYQGQLLADGGIANNFPLEPLIDCDILIGSDVNYYEPSSKKISTQELLAKSIAISLNQSTIVKQDQCHIFIQPQSLSNYHILDFDNADAIIDLGYQEACHQLQSHLDLI